MMTHVLQDCFPECEPLNRPPHRQTSYILLNEPRTGSSWLQEVSQMHPGIKVQFELDLNLADDALVCKQCNRPWALNSKNMGRLPPKLHPPLACGMTMFGSNNRFDDVAAVAARHNASLIIVLRRNHLAHVVSSYRHFRAPKGKHDAMVPWTAQQLRHALTDSRDTYRRLLAFPAATGRPAHLIFYEDLKRNPNEVWHAMQTFLGLPVHELDNISMLERKSTARPSITYLHDLHALQRAINGTDEWRDMIMDPLYDDDVDLAAEFAAACAEHPAADMSWRLQFCDGGVARSHDVDVDNTTPPPESPSPEKGSSSAWRYLERMLPAWVWAQ